MRRGCQGSAQRRTEAQTIKRNLEQDAKKVLEFMASNGLVANQSKTEFLVLNEKDKTSTELREINVGDTSISRTTHTKLLGVIIEESQEWNYHVNGLKSSLNQRLFIIRRIIRQIPRTKIMSVVHSLWVSKLRYGLQLCTKVRLTTSESTTANMKALQLTQNRLLRMLNGSKIKDKVSTQSMLKKFGLLSVNRLAAKIKLVEIWKSLNREDYPISLEPYKQISAYPSHMLRQQNNRIFADSCRLHKSESSFHIDAARLWNLAPDSIRVAQSLNTAKKAIEEFCETLPL